MQKRQIFSNEIINLMHEEIYTTYNQEFIDDIDTITRFSKHIVRLIKDDFYRINKCNKCIENELLNLNIGQILYSLIGITKKAFEKYIENGIIINYLDEDILEYYELELDDVINSLIDIFKVYYEVVFSQPVNKDIIPDIIEIFTIYISVIMSIIHSLPQSYKEYLLTDEKYAIVNEKLAEQINSYAQLVSGNITILDVKELPNDIKKHIETKYDINFYNFTKRLKR